MEGKVTLVSHNNTSVSLVHLERKGNDVNEHGHELKHVFI